MTNRERVEHGFAALQRGEVRAAEHVFDEVLARDPNHASALHGKGRVLQLRGEHGPAMELLSRATRKDTTSSEAQFHLAIAQWTCGHRSEAIASLQRAAKLAPTVAKYHAALGTLLHETGESQRGGQALRRAVELDPREAIAWANLAAALGALDDPEASAHAAQQALVLNPKLTLAHLNLGHALEMLGDADGAIAAYRAALVIEPENPDAHFNLATMLLLRGNFEQGWIEHEWRFRTTRNPIAAPLFDKPLWNGSNLDGTLLVYAEQGLGDTIHFARYLPMVRQRVKRIVLRCPRETRTLMKTVSGVDEVVSSGDALPAFDAHVPLLSLPRVFKTTLQTIPATVPYLRCDEAKRAHFAQRLGAKYGRRIGLCWAGSPQHPRDKARSIDPELLGTLADVADVQWVSLQKNRLGTPPLQMIDLTAELDDMSDAAALIENLDRVITVDTSVAHLAGALGKNVWTLLPFAPDWRWLRDRSDTPWYPTMRLFRQPARGDWASVIADVNAALRLGPESQ